MDIAVFASPHHKETHAELEAVADATLLVDNHAHPFWLPRLSHTVYNMPHLVDVFSLSTNIPRASLAFCRSLRDMQRLIVPDASCRSPTTSDDEDSHILHAQTEVETIVEDARAKMGPWHLARRCFEAAGIAAVLIDDGIPCPPTTLPVQLPDFQTRLNVPVARRVLRLETEAEFALTDVVMRNEQELWIRQTNQSGSSAKRPGTTLRAKMFCCEFKKRLHPLPDDVVSFNTVAAYRTGLGINLNWTDDDLEDALATMSFSDVTSGLPRDKPHFRLSHRVIIDYIVRMGLEAARENSIPIQFHCGIGHGELDLSQSDPLLLAPILKRFVDVRIVLLHACWPYTRKAAYLASIYPNLYLDIGLAIPLLSVRGMFRAVEEALEVAPVTKLLYSSDAHTIPDVFFLSARWGRRIVASVLAASVVSRDLCLSEAKIAVKQILADNAIRLYRLPVHS